MAELALCFREEGKKNKYRPPSKREIGDITSAAQGASAIIRVMQRYATNNPKGEEGDTLGVYGCVFGVLEWLMDPVTDYLFEYAGKEAKQDKAADSE
jgi:hypothetical protein